MDVEGFEEWYRREHPKLVNTLFLVSGTVDSATDATDEAFARAAAQWSRVRTMEYPSAWTYRVALNVLRKSARRRSRETDLHVKASEGGRLPPPTEHPELWDAVRTLAPRQRVAIVLRYVADLPEQQVASVLGVSRGTVASTLSRARALLAESLSDDPALSKGEQ
jgi:RNA polymerase sigma factor (sigma-70 family)